MAKKSVKDEIIDQIKETDKPKRESARDKRKKVTNIDRNIEVCIMNNKNTNFFFKHPRLPKVIDLFGWGATDYMTIDELRTMHGVARKVFDNFEVIITDVLSDEYTLEDILVYLGLDRKYKEILDENLLDLYGLDDLILNTHEDDFEDLLNKLDKKLLARIVERSIILFKKKDLKEYGKMELLKEVTKNEYLFEDAKDKEIDIND